jgi:hypothetical protein
MQKCYNAQLRFSNGGMRPTDRTLRLTELDINHEKIDFHYHVFDCKHVLPVKSEPSFFLYGGTKSLER